MTFSGLAKDKVKLLSKCVFVRLVLRLSKLTVSVKTLLKNKSVQKMLGRVGLYKDYYITIIFPCNWWIYKQT